MVGPPQCVLDEAPVFETIEDDIGICEAPTGPGSELNLTTAENDDGFICFQTPGIVYFFYFLHIF